MMLSSDREVEKYLGFIDSSYKNLDFGRKCAITPGRLKFPLNFYHKQQLNCGQTKASIKRPSSAADITNTITPSSNQLPKTPRKSKSCQTTPSSKRTPCKTPNTDTDRYIPSRSRMDYSTSHHRILKFEESSDIFDEKTTQQDLVLEQEESQVLRQNMSDNLNQLLNSENNVSNGDKRILQFYSPVKKTPTKATPYTPPSVSSSKRKKTRHIPRAAERVLDAPGYVNDYYLNLLDWSKCVDLVAVALEKSVYAWTPSSGEITHLCQLTEPEDYVTSVRWVEDGPHIAVGTALGCIQLWDVQQKKRLRQMCAHSSRVGVLAWNGPTLSSGSRNGAIYNHDVRIAEHHTSSLYSHRQEVCGLQWSPSGRYLASGCNSNVLAVWDANSIGTSPDPLHSFTQHQAAVKAVSWCPWQHHILASGGGANDKKICFWNVNNGTCINTIDTGSQVSSIVWNEEHRELMSGHGHPNNQLTVWDYSTLAKRATLLGHSSRVLQLALSPDGTRVMSAAADETLRLWNCFQPNNANKTPVKKKRRHDDTILSMTTIR